MKGLSLRHMADACCGVLHLAQGKEHLADIEASGIVADSRQAEEGVVFAAIKGERADGHTFIPQVFAAGALAVITEQELPSGDSFPAWIKVPSTLQALKDIAEYYLKVLGIPVVGITGSVGKTSTKEIIASVLSQKYNVLKTAGNFNNELGLPLTVFRIREEHQIAVLEMGISDFGEMHRLARIARPRTCVITNIGRCHLEFLHDRDGVLRAKTEIFDFLPGDGHVVLNGDDDKLCAVQNVHGIQPVFFGFREEQQTPLSVWADELEERGLTGTSCRIHTPSDSFEVLVPKPGRHMVMDALAAAAVGLLYGLNADEIRRGIENPETVSGRFQLVNTGFLTIVDDCYNANPASMEASLKALRSVTGRKAAILGDMFELGEEELPMHREVGRCAGESGLCFLAAVGTRSRELAAGAREAAPDLDIRYFETTEDFFRQAGSLPFEQGDTVLVKASHGMRFDRIVEECKRRYHTEA